MSGHDRKAQGEPSPSYASGHDGGARAPRARGMNTVDPLMRAARGEQDHKPTPGPFKSKQQLDVVIGFVGFWAVIVFITTLWHEVSGQNALGWALALLGFVVALWGLWIYRKRLPSKPGRH